MKWIKNENNSIDIDYFREDLVIHTQQVFDNGNFSIQLKTVNITHKTLSSILFFSFLG
jgi:hypothetical protein